jgi:hypothetical protein
MNKLFLEWEDYSKYKHLLKAPLEADKQLKVSKKFCHSQKLYGIINDKIKYFGDEKIISILDKITDIYFLYIDFGLTEWDSKYWFFVGKLTDELYFTYEVECSGTGFGIGEESTIYISRKKELLSKYGFTNQHRNLIDENIEKRFIYPENTNEINILTNL